MPVEEGRFIPHEALAGIAGPGFSMRLWVSTQHSGGDYAGARNNVKQYALTDRTLMLDNDVVLTPGCVRRLWDFLDANGDYAAVALSKHNAPAGRTEVEDYTHIDMSCVLFRREMLRGRPASRRASARPTRWLRSWAPWVSRRTTRSSATARSACDPHRSRSLVGAMIHTRQELRGSWARLAVTAGCPLRRASRAAARPCAVPLHEPSGVPPIARS